LAAFFFEGLSVGKWFQFPLFFKKIEQIFNIKIFKKMPKKTALIIVDVQGDFVWGSLKVPNGELVAAEINRLRALLPEVDIFLTQDWHAANHISFYTQHPGFNAFDEKTLDDGSKQILWPPHCVQGSIGAAFVGDLVQMPTDTVIQKGTYRTVDSYSGFASNDGHSEVTALEGLLKERNITHVLVCGLAFEYCVGFTALDAVKCGLEVAVVRSCSKGINEADCAKMEAKLVATGKAVVVEDVASAVAFASA
jgi:nicotinamidase/pyrazinamidase